MKNIAMLPIINSLEYNKGGQHTVVKKLYLSEELQKNVKFFLIPTSGDINTEKLKKYNFIVAFKMTSIGFIIAFLRKIILSYKHIKGISQKTIISHDYVDSYVIAKFFKKTKLVTVQHSQGSLYTEFTDLHGYKKSFILKSFLNYVESSIYKRSEITGFPSRGAKEALLITHPKLKSFVKDKPLAVLYNGVPIDNSLKSLTKVKQPIEIITVSKVNMAKGIDQIPELLDLLKKQNIDFHWTLLGQGPLEEKLKKQINFYNISDKMTWVKDRLPHAEVMKYFKKSHYYICLHRFSIFDFSILEAMLHGCIPILSNVGGNKEFIQWGNGILVKNSNQFPKELERLETKREDIQEQNFNIVKVYFSEQNFYQVYIDLVSKLIPKS